MKIMALDLGDVWTGTALSDELGITARPYQTVKSKELYDFLRETIEKEKIGTIVIGYPVTMRGTESEQTKKVVAEKERLERAFPDITFDLFDERLTSKQAARIKKSKTKADKIAAHSIAAAVILTTYLMLLSHAASQ